MSTAELKKKEAVLLGGWLNTAVYMCMCAFAGSRALWSLTHLTHFEKKKINSLYSYRGPQITFVHVICTYIQLQIKTERFKKYLLVLENKSNTLAG